MSSIGWKHTIKALKSGLKTYGDLPQADPTMDQKHLLLNTGKDYPQVSNNLMNNKVCWAFIDTDHNIQSVHSLVNTTDGYAGILGDKLDSNKRVLLGGVTTLTSCFVSIGDKEVATKGNQQFLDEPGTEELKAAGDLPVLYITPTLLSMVNKSMVNNRADSQIVALPKNFPFKLGSDKASRTLCPNVPCIQPALWHGLMICTELPSRTARSLSLVKMVESSPTPTGIKLLLMVPLLVKRSEKPILEAGQPARVCSKLNTIKEVE